MIVRCSYHKLVPIKELKRLFHPENPNNHPDYQLDRLAQILKYSGARTAARISNLTGRVTAGQGRILAAERAGWKKYPVDYQDYENDDMELADLNADNAIALWAEINMAMVNTQIGTLSPEFNIEMFGFQNLTIDVAEKMPDETDEEKSEESDDREEKIEENEQIPEKIEPRTKLHDHFRIGQQHELYNGDCLERMKLLENESIHSLISDPPAGIAFMGKDWDEDKGGGKEWIAWMTRVMEQAFRVLKPGAHGLVWAIPRTSHWTASALEDAGFEIRDVVTHVFGSGFPKSMDISKAIDKQAGAERQVIGPSPFANKGRTSTHNSMSGAGTESFNEVVTAPSTPDAKKWQGFGTALKPASEHWILVRKPISEKTVAANVLQHGTGGINIDASRIGANESQGRFPSNFILSHNPDCVEMGTKKVKGEKPRVMHIEANECTAGCAVAELDRQSGITKSGDIKPGTYKNRAKETNVAYGQYGGVDSSYDPVHKGDSGGASRFFYVAKPSKREKNEGCEELPSKFTATMNDGIGEREHNPKEKSAYNSNHHPTVKSLKLMSYLINMVTPLGGTLIDPFGGSGTTLVAAEINGFKSILFEQSLEYSDIILARAEKVTKTRAKLLNGSVDSEMITKKKKVKKVLKKKKVKSDG